MVGLILGDTVQGRNADDSDGLLAKLNDEELRILRNGLGQIAIKLEAAAKFRSMLGLVFQKSSPVECGPDWPSE